MLEIENPSVRTKAGDSSICFPFEGGMSWQMTSSLTSKLRCFVTHCRDTARNLRAHKRSVLDQLIAKGLVEPAPQEKSPGRFQLTGRAQHLLAERGVGICGG
jgi:hypothetical protein